MGISPRLATGRAVRGAWERQWRHWGSRLRTEELLQLHDGAACSQLVMDRVSVRVVLAMLVIEVILVDGARGVVVNCKCRHAG